MKKQKESHLAKIGKRLLLHANFYRFNYLKHWVVAIIDVALATGVSGLVFVMYAPIIGPLGRMNMLYVFLLAAAASALAFYAFKTYRIIIRFMNIRSLLPIGVAAALKSALLTLFLYSLHFLEPELYYKFFLLDTLITLFVLIAIRIVMLVAYGLVNEKINTGSQKVLIYGIDEKSASLLLRFH